MKKTYYPHTPHTRRVNRRLAAQAVLQCEININVITGALSSDGYPPASHFGELWTRLSLIDEGEQRRNGGEG